MSLVGHYERTAEHLASRDGLGSYPAVDGPTLLRIRARSVGSLLRGLLVMAHHVLTRSQPMIGVPRSNSRAVRLFTALFLRTAVFSYSDGLGDSVHRFYLDGAARYVGHVGFALLSPQPLIHTIALEQCIEPWSRFIRYEPGAPWLVIVKRPKELELSPSLLARLHARVIAVLARRGKVLLSGTVAGLESAAEQIGPLARLQRPLSICGVVGLPSTAFLTLATRLPVEHLRILELPCARQHPEARRTNLLMQQTLKRCLDAMHGLS